MDLREAVELGVTRHPWEESRFRFFARLARRHGLLDRPLHVLDVGSGDAWFARQLLKQLPTGSHIDCWDIGYDADSARVLGVHEDGITLSPTPPEGRADLVLMLDVLEHVEHDAAFLGEVVGERLAAGGAALISVPCWPMLQSAHDEQLGHYRRYTPGQARNLVRGAGLRIEREGPLFVSLPPARALLALSERFGRAGGAPPRRGNRLLAKVLAVDARLCARLPSAVPGLSWWALCR